MSRQYIKIPRKLLDILEKPQVTIIESCAYKYGQILQDNKVVFFQEYTDHGIEHVESVLLSAVKIISEDSYLSLNSDDVMVLILSIILHDLGMHISIESFQNLIKDDEHSLKCNSLDEHSWKMSWQEYLHEAKRFNDAQLLAIFGNENTEIIEIDFANKYDYSVKLSGEFLRRMHPRLAHEIALIGFPVKEGEARVTLSKDLELAKADLAGLIARSHGMNLRDTFKYLEDQYDISWSTPYNIKVVFHMAILRIADYIQIESDRISEIILKTKRLSSPVSKQEWEKHKSIDFINTEVSDPERIYVQANPLSSEIYLGLEKLFKGIQSELDTTWAVLGEVYGRSKHKNIGLNYRRIQSNLDNKKKFQESINYIADVVKFDADPDILKLLIGPLYGEDPTYGVRELLQNSVDAVKERKYIESNNGNLYDDLIQIELKKINNKVIFCLKDNGVGMSKDTLIHYFFKAGASFRKSESWLKDFIKDGDVKIERTGRFGVGVLAAFLLGSKIMVQTKSINKSYGLEFETELSDGQIELKKVDCDFGTYMEITLTDKVFRELESAKNHSLNWFTWYRLQMPKIEFIIPKEYKNKFKYLKKEDLFPEHNVPNMNWRNFQTEDYEVYWTLDNSSRYFNNMRKFRGLFGDEEIKNNLLINGFNIPYSFQLNECYNWATPLISVIDKNGKSPLSLNRNYLLNNKLPFEKKLLENIAVLALKEILNVKFEKHCGLYIPKSTSTRIKLKVNQQFSNQIIVYGDSYTLDHQLIHYDRKTSMTYSIWLEDNDYDIVSKFNNLGYSIQKPLKNTNVAYSETIDSYYSGRDTLNKWFDIGGNNAKAITWVRVFMKKEKFEHLFDPKKQRVRTAFKSNINIEEKSKNWICFTYISDNFYSDKCFPVSHSEIKKSSINLIDLESDSNSVDLIIERKFGYFKKRHQYSFNDDFIDKKEPIYKRYKQFGTFEKLITKYFPKDLLIPIDIEKRKTLLNSRLSELGIQII